ncbi:MAG: RsmD family RNA methyltransferase [Planctomycetota bacterium]|jgi:16S rRNA (guanine966-N2)-methyltransferase
MRIGAGRFKGRALPRARKARPVPGRLRTSLFSVLEARLPGARVLDLFAGVGGFGLEALSRGAKQVVLLDLDASAVRALNAWLAAAGAAGEGRAERWDVRRGALPPGPFDLVFVDPPYRHWETRGGFEVLAQAVAALAPEGVVAVKIPARTEIPADARFTVLRRRSAGSVAWVLIGPPQP